MMYYNTVNELLKSTLITIMRSSVFESFRLVGGTALSLQLGHRLSVENTQNKRSSRYKKPTVFSIKDLETLEDYAFSW